VPLFDTIVIALIISLDEEEHHSGWTMMRGAKKTVHWSAIELQHSGFA
jgi:hypothetical protein